MKHAKIKDLVLSPCSSQFLRVFFEDLKFQYIAFCNER